MVSTQWKNISQNGNLPQIGVNIRNVWNHQLDNSLPGWYLLTSPCWMAILRFVFFREAMPSPIHSEWIWTTTTWIFHLSQSYNQTSKGNKQRGECWKIWYQLLKFVEFFKLNWTLGKCPRSLLSPLSRKSYTICLCQSHSPNPGTQNLKAQSNVHQLPPVKGFCC